MARETGAKHNRLNIEYWGGLNSSVSYRLAKRSEPVHMENARAPIIGVLEKRQGQAKFGTKPNGDPFTSVANYGLVKFLNDGEGQGVYRVSEMTAIPAPSPVPVPGPVVSLSAYEEVWVEEEVTTNHPDYDVIHNTGWCLPFSSGGKTFPGSPGFTDDGYTDKNFGYAQDGNYAIENSFSGNNKAQSYTSSSLYNYSYPAGAFLSGIEVETSGCGLDNLGSPHEVFESVFLFRRSTNTLVGGVTFKSLIGTSGGIGGGDTVNTWGSSTTTPDGDPISAWSISDFQYGPVYGGGYAYPYMVHAHNASGQPTHQLWLDGIKIRLHYKIIYPASKKVFDGVSVTDSPLTGKTIGNTLYIYPVRTEGTTNIYWLSDTDHWEILEDWDAQALIGGSCDFTVTEGNLIMVNGVDENRYIEKDGRSVTTASDPGHLYNSPLARKAVFYKNRIYLGDFYHSGVRYPTSVVRSSYPVGLISTTSADVSAGTNVDVPLADTKYLYSATGMNEYDIYRGNTHLGTVTVAEVKETSVTLVSLSFAIKASDEVWVAGTYNGTKQYRWQTNSSSVGRDVKQYDTMKLSGGDEDPLTLLETVGNVLIVGNKNTLMAWNDYNFENFDIRVGSVSNNGYIKFMGSLYFLHYSGIYATTGGAPTLLSRKIDRYIRGATKAGLEASAAGYKGLSVFFTLGDVTLYNDDGSLWKVLPDVVAEYHTANKDWYIHTNIPASEFENFVDNTGAERLLMTHEDTGKYVKEFLVGSLDDGQEIFFRVDTQILVLMAEFEWYLNPIGIIVETDRGTSMKVFMSPDEDQDFYELPGTVSKGVTILKGMAASTDTPKPVLGRHVRLSFRDSSPQLCRLMQASILYIPTQMDYSE